MSEKKYSRSKSAVSKDDKKVPYLVLAFFSLGFIAIILVAVFSMSISSPLAGDCVAVLEINGEITTQSVPTSLFSEGVYGSYELANQIDSINDDEHIGAAVFIINSPGGSVVASDEIYRSIDSVDKPTVSYFREMAASGGYYIATPTDYIVSEPNALTGSIGTVMYLMEFADLADKIGVGDVVIKSGEMKDMGNPMRNMTSAEEDVLNTIVLEAFDDFKYKITSNRGDKLDYTLYNQALDGRVLSGTMAYEAGLVDELGSRETAIMHAADLAGIPYESADDINLCYIRTSPEPAGLFDMHSFIDGLFAGESAPSLTYR